VAGQSLDLINQLVFGNAVPNMMAGYNWTEGYLALRSYWKTQGATLGMMSNPQE